MTNTEKDQKKYDKALQKVLPLAYKEFGWPRSFDPLIVVDERGNVINCHGAKINENEASWIENEIWKIID